MWNIRCLKLLKQNMITISELGIVVMYFHFFVILLMFQVFEKEDFGQYENKDSSKGSEIIIFDKSFLDTWKDQCLRFKLQE